MIWKIYEEFFSIWMYVFAFVVVLIWCYFYRTKNEKINSIIPEKTFLTKKRYGLNSIKNSLLIDSQKSAQVSTSAHKSLMSQFPYFLKNIQVFGHLEKELLDELWKHIEIIRLEKNKIFAKPGDKDDSIYIVQSGRLIVYIKSGNTQFPVKIVEKGDSVFSTLSILDVLTNYPSELKTVSVKADVPSVVYKLCAKLFREELEKYPESLIRVVQNIALNLQHVTFDTLHSFLGLTQELLKPMLNEQRTKKATKGSSPGSKPPESKTLPDITSEGTVTKPNSEGISCATYRSEKTNPKLSKRDKYLQVYGNEFVRKLGFTNTEDPNLYSKIDVVSYPSGFVLCEQGSQSCSLYYVIYGKIEMLQETIGDNKPVVISKACHNEVVGSLAILTGASFYSLRTSHPTLVAEIKKEDLYDLMKGNPTIVMNLAHFLVQRISPFVRQIDFALSWLMCDAGHILYKQKDSPDALYLVLSGRLRAAVMDADGERILDEFCRSDVVGMIEAFTEQSRASTVISVRSTELAKLPQGLLNFIKHEHPQTINRLVKLLGAWMVRQHEHKLTGTLESLTHAKNLNTIAVMAVSLDIFTLNCFTLELAHAINTIKPTLRLSVDVVERSLGRTALERVNKYRLLSWLNRQEEAYGVVLYQCELGLSYWTKRCIKQADCIIIVANGNSTPTVGPIGVEFDNLAKRTQKELVLLWPSTTKRPHDTSNWLRIRSDFAAHYHIHAPDRMFNKTSNEELLRYYERKFAQGADKFSDFSRLARMLTGTSVGLALGGGGARGASHIGVIRALKEAGIPVDIVGGTSIGAFIGGIYCGDPNWRSVKRKARVWFMKMSSFWSKLLDLTYPYSSLFSGDGFNQTIQEVFQDTQIEDLWLPYFNVTTDITASEMRVHQTGALWRYCRGSMSLAGYLPPICSEDDGHLLLDGGYVNNLPADVMRNMGAATILAVDVGAKEKEDLTNYGDYLSGWWLLWKKYCPFTEPVNVLNMAEIQARLAYVSCCRQLDIVKRAPYVYYMRPSIEKYNTLDFQLFDEIQTLGYDCGRLTCDSWLKSGKLQEFFSSQISPEEQIKSRIKSDSFADLAALCVTDVRSLQPTPEERPLKLDSPSPITVDTDKNDKLD